MLENLVAWVLNNYLGKYVENLNTDQLSIALLSGEVELENLPLRKDALRHIGLPIQVRAGFIGKVKLQIPVSQIRSAPWMIVIEQLYLVAGPVRLSEWYADAEEIISQELKQAALDAIEARWRAEIETAQQTGYYASSYSSWVNYGTGLMTNIVENLQLKIKDVHIRYEDDITVPGQSFACGFTIHSLSAQSCDSNWAPGFTQWDSSSASFKLVELSDLAIYWDAIHPPEGLLGDLNISDLTNAMCPNISSSHEYILKPVSAKAYIKRDRSEQPLRSRLKPRIACDLNLEEVPLSLIDRQYEQMVRCIRGLDEIARLRRYRLYRPCTTIKEDARAWWIYAIRCISGPQRCPSFCLPKPTWDTCLERAKENVKYVDIYSKILTTPSAALGAESKALKDSIEWNRTLEELKALREVSMKKVPKPTPTAVSPSQGRSMLARWFPQWWYSTPSQEKSLDSPETANVAKTQLEDELLDALADTFENNTLLKRDSVFGQFNFTLKQGTFYLCTIQESSAERTSMIELQYENVKLCIESRPRTASHKFEITLGALYLRDKLTPDTQFPVLIAPQCREQGPVMTRIGSKLFTPRSSRLSTTTAPASNSDPLFQLCYEQKPFNSTVDYRIQVKSRSLDIVYNPGAAQWLAAFLAGPHQQRINLPTRSRLGADLIKNWEHILEGNQSERKSYDLQFDISAPQIIFVEQFSDRNAAVAVIDFGRLLLSNKDKQQLVSSKAPVSQPVEYRDSEDDDNFQTPCSTPPGSETSDSDPITTCTAAPPNLTSASLTDLSIHEKLYESYCVELNDLQILIGKVRDNWKYAHTKGTSALHVLDRFNISLQIERRVIYTTDPQYPTFTLNANLPKLVVHVNEQKIFTIRKLYNIIISKGLPSPFKSPQNHAVKYEQEPSNLPENEQDLNHETLKILILQFSVDQMALEVQSRGRSIAELQVAGVRLGFTQRASDTSISLSVHGLLLVDALQTFGPDFELLIASHKHVGMDSVSGSLRDSEPCSPTSPGSPDPTLARIKTTSPIALTQALSSLSSDVSGFRASSPTRSIASSPPSGLLAVNARGSIIGLEQLDVDALILIEVLLIGGPEPLQHANIQFNNLDIIANQETIVELMGFVRRVFPQLKSTGKQPTEPHILKEYMSQSDGISLQNDKAVSRTKTEILFDFHRLNVLLLRGVMKDNTIQGRKIATATMSEAKIQATVDTSISVEGSLGGLQILDLTPEGHTHQRIISVGKDPLVEQEKTSRDLLTTLDAELYTMGQNTSKQIEDQRAFSFTIKRQLQCEDGNAFADVKIRMASLWYTHSPQFLMELQSCATEFKQYLTNLARSIKSAATDMAMGLVHARAEALAHSLYMNSRFTGSMHGMSAGDVISPRRRKRSNSQSSEHIEGVSGYTSFKGTTLHTPYSPEDEEINIEIKLDIVLDSPVVILPKTSMSSQVFVAHLGKITINNNNDGNFDLNQTGDTQKRDCNEPSLWDSLTTHTEYYNIDIRDMKLYSLDISNRRMGSQIGLSSLERVEELYSCSEAGQPILHDTVLKLTVIKRVRSDNSLNENFPSLLMGHSELDLDEHDTYFSDNIQISGCVVSPLKVSLTKSQYEQVLDTFHTLVSSNKLLEQHESLGMRQMSTLGEIVEEDSGLTTLSMDSQLRSRLFTNAEQHEPKKEIENKLNMMKVSFKVPELTFELRGNRGNGEQGLVDLSFQDFVVEYEKFHRYETNIQVSLRSLLMEDLLRPPESKHRCMVISSATNELQFGPCYLSQSCPDLTNNPIQHSSSRGSLPDHLETKNVFGAAFPKKVPCPRTPPPSPNQKPKSHDNLVLISCLLVDPNVPNFKSHYNSLQRYTAVDFNCLDMVISVESWVIVLDFFGVDSKNVPERKISTNIEPVDTASQDSIQGNSELLVEVRSLTLVFIGPEQEVAKANISNLSVDILDRSANISGNFHPSELQQRVISGQLGSMSLYDLTPHGHLYRERFVSAGQQALNFNYIRLSEAEAASSSYDTQLCLEMSSVLYVHTKRFVREIQTFFAHFSQLQSVMSSIRSATQGMTIKKLDEKPLRLSIELHAGSPVILLPVSSRSSEILVADLGKLTVSNCFQFAGSDQNTNINKTKENRCLLNIMYIDLVNMDLYAAKRAPIDKNSPSRALGLNKPSSSEGLELGASRIVKQGPSLLTEKCHLKLRVEKNLHSDFYHDVADMSIQGTLSTLEGALDLSQYKLIRGLLAYNLGEDIADLTPSSNNDGFVIIQGGQDPLSTLKDVWTVLFIRLDLVNVNLRLCISHEEAPLACINFIKSKLTIETFSNATEDIDLASQEIQLMDMRFNANPINKRSNVFTNILQSIHTITQNDNVQAEIHSRRRSDHTKHTILLNNMRLMAILDWWEAVRDFIFEPPELPPKDTYEYKVKNSEKNGSQINSHESVEEVASFELKLNITDSEVVIVEDTSQWDTNAVILKSTTVISYRPSVPEKPLSCNLNHCEMFSCILGMEDETALSIIDPVTVNMEVNKDGILEVQLQHFCVRLSYHDMMMFMQIVNSVPKQTKWAKSQTHVPPTNSKGQIANLSALGFSSNDCIEALETCEGKLEDAALWLTKNANVLEENEMQNKKSFKIMALEIKTSCLSLCIIDDCRDADVPLIELSLSELTVRQVVNSSTPDTNSDSHSDVSPAINDISSGWLECVLAGDYYNRVLSGWEPFIEPWKCEIGWEYNLQKNRLQLDIRSPELLNFNITSTLIDLYSQVKDTWTQDYYNISSTKDSMDKQSNSPPGYRRRSPFVPFALKNDTGSKMWFSTMITTTDKMFETEKISLGQPDESWKEVQPGETIPFTFEGRGKLRHQDTHKLRIHQLKVKVEGWRPVKAISVDKVGIYFRHATSEIQKSSLDTTRSRIVFAVDLEGSARKLITVRSALLLKNHLPDMVEINLKSNSIPTAASLISPSKSIFLPSQGVLSIPLSLVNSSIFVRPVDSKHAYMYPNTALKWSHIVRPGDIIQELYECRSQRDQIYRFCLSIHRENYPWDRSITSVMNTQPQPAHTLTLRSPILITNLLPHDLRFSVVRGPTGTILPSASLSLHEVDMDNLLEFSFHLDNFPGAGTLLIPPGATTFNCRVRIQDQSHRSLFLNSSVVILKGCGIEITITSPFWIINKTGIPLIFRQEGVTAETAGQFEEHEIARMVAPLLFSLSDPDASPTVVARVGNCVVSSGNPQWCQHFHLQPGIQTRKLRVTMRDNRPDIIYLIGIDVRTGRGRHRDTNIVTISPKFQLHNKSSFQLQFAQKYFATTLNDLRAQATYLQAVPNCHLAFHWPRLDKDQLLCVRILDISDCCWSGGFRIDSNHSLHINIRDINGRMYFLRLDIVLQGATFFIVFTDADTMPPPIRIDNYSEVPLTFSQACCKDTKICTARAHSSVPYALDEPTEPPNITVIAPGGITATYDMNKLGEGKQLTYENFIYISFYGTFKGSPTRDPFDIESQHLVLDVGAGGRIILAQKQPGHRSQLWRMSSSGQLQHEGSSPPRPPQQPYSDKILVLDIEGPAPQPRSYTSLMLRRADPRRRSTQTWRFTDDGRLCCAHSNMCVQAKDGFFGLRQGSTAVLGMINPSASHRFTETGIPLEQAVGRQRLRPGSGFLKLEITTDGPTRVLKVYDIKEKRMYAVSEERDWANISVTQRPNLLLEQYKSHHKETKELDLTMQLSSGIGVSIVSRRPAEELLFAHLKGIILNLIITDPSKNFNISVEDIQIDNQLFETSNPVLVNVTKPTRGEEDKYMLPALRITAEILSSPNENAVIYKHLIVSLKPLAVNLEERLILKLFAFASYNKTEQETLETDENDYEIQRILTEVTATHSKRYYFGIIKLAPHQIRLSMMTANKLPPQLQIIKKKLRLTLINFEDAAVDLEPFVKQHPFESSQFLINSILKHFKDEIKWQAAIILGSVDFLGNPLGFVNDVTEGVSGLIYEGSVGALVKNVTHGISNSAAKVTESLSDGLGKVTMDDEHEETRIRIRQTHSGSSSDHLVAGIKGLGFGILGGATGIFKQIYDGATNEGIPGVFSGIGKGLVGAVTKPVVGVLDLASETARAVRDSSRSSSRVSPPRFRPPRCVIGPGGLLPNYSKGKALGQQHLYTLNSRNYSEILVAYKSLRSPPEDLRVIVTSEFVRVVTNASSGNALATVIEVHLSDLIYCTPITMHEPGVSLHYIELSVCASGGSTAGLSSTDPVRRPQIRCDSKTLANWVSQQINYAKSMYEERLHTLIPDVNTED